jgi:hypothetical protein
MTWVEILILQDAFNQASPTYRGIGIHTSYHINLNHYAPLEVEFISNVQLGKVLSGSHGNSERKIIRWVRNLSETANICGCYS